MFLVLLFVAQLANVQSLECYHCMGVRRVSDCHTVVTCPADGVCSTETYKRRNKLYFNLACKEWLDCDSITGSGDSITGSGTSDCSQCCDVAACNTYLCSSETQNAAWSRWSTWGTCSATCNGGLQSRTRTCTNPSPTQFGRDCRGTDFMQQICNTQNCPETVVGFSVYFDYTRLTSDGTVRFGRKVMNTGSYNKATGKFTCPVAGIYMFTLTIMHDNSNVGTAKCTFTVNGARKNVIEAIKDQNDQSTASMVVTLAVGDVVAPKCSGWDYAFHDKSSSFSGVLITPM